MKIEDFMKEFADLLDKYGIEIFAKDEDMGYPERGEDIQIRIEATCDGPMKEYYEDIDFGGYLDAKKLRTTADMRLANARPKVNCSEKPNSSHTGKH